MRDDLLFYYERELTYLRRTGAAFAARYPKVAGRLELEATKCDDPHVERILEAFAFLAARVHLKLDDDLPEISEALLSIVYPHYARPLPSLSLVQFGLDPEQGKLTSGLTLPRDTMLYSRPVAGTPCRFRTCYETTLWPLTVTDAKWLSPHELRPAVRAPDAVAALRVVLHCLPDVRLAELSIEALRVFLSAEPGLAATLYEMLCNSCARVLARAPGGAPAELVELPPSVIRPVGFGRDEGLLPWSPRSFVGYRLLQEYFAFPEKFLFLDIGGFDRIRAAVPGEALELVFLIRPFERPDRRAMLEAGVNRDTFRLGCSPVVNLFPQTAEPILLTQRRHEYQIVPDARRRDAIGIFSVDDVVAVTPGAAEPLRFAPLYSYQHGADAPAGLHWFATRRPSQWRTDEGTDVFLTFVDAHARLAHPDQDAVTVRLTCHNGTLPSRLPFGSPDGDFTLQGGGPVQRIVAMVKPTEPVEPPLGRAQLWRLISQLSLNYVSLVEGGVEAFRELLRLHDIAGAAAAERQIGGVLSVRGEPCFARIEGEHGLSFARGNRIEIEFDEEPFAGGGVFLLSAVLDRYLGLAVSLNSFSQLAVRTRQRKEPLREWTPRAGWKALL
jgi:type VI secretion system protein ImpG